MSSASTRVTTRAADLETMMATSRGIAPTHHAYTLAGTGAEFLITDRVFVRFKEPLAAKRVTEFAKRYALLQLEKYSDRDYLFQLTDHTGMNPVKFVVALTESEPLVAVADNDLNYRVKKHAFKLPTDPDYRRQWHLHGHFKHASVDPRANARCERAWELLNSFGSRDVVIGIIDEGCDLDHPDFDSRGKFASWGYFQGRRLVTRGETDAQASKMSDPGNHGTSCAGVCAAQINGTLTVGAAPGCRILPIKLLSLGDSLSHSDSKLLTALTYLADKVDVVSNSWSVPPPRSLYATHVIQRVTELASTGGRRGRGILFLWAAGNENCPLQYTANIKVPYTDGWNPSGDRRGKWVGVQKDRDFCNNLVGIPGVMHVAALASTARRSHYSNYGYGISVCAPSSNKHTYLRMEVAGLRIITTKNGSVGKFGGTSSAAPLVAGIAALVISANPRLTAFEVASILQRTACKDLNLHPYRRTPPAPFNRDTSWDVSPIAPFDSGIFQDTGHPDGTWSPWFGYGRVDAAAAVAAAVGLERPRRQGRQTLTPAKADIGSSSGGRRAPGADGNRRAVLSSRTTVERQDP